MLDLRAFTQYILGTFPNLWSIVTAAFADESHRNNRKTTRCISRNSQVLPLFQLNYQYLLIH